MGSGMYSLGFSQVPGQVLCCCYRITFLHSKYLQHSSYHGLRKPIWILLILLRHLQSVFVDSSALVKLTQFYTFPHFMWYFLNENDCST